MLNDTDHDDDDVDDDDSVVDANDSGGDIDNISRSFLDPVADWYIFSIKSNVWFLCQLIWTYQVEVFILSTYIHKFIWLNW